MVIPGISNVCFTALSAFIFLCLQELYIVWSFYLVCRVLLGYHISDLTSGHFICCIVLFHLSLFFHIPFFFLLLLIWLLLCFLHNFGFICHPGYLEILCMWCCSFIYTRIPVHIHSFLACFYIFYFIFWSLSISH